MRTLAVLLAAITTLAVAIAAPSSAEARAGWCGIPGSGVTYNRAGDAALFEDLKTLQGMNCASGQYVMRWLRRDYRRSYERRLPTSFWDGYVTWYCGKTSRLRWRCDEYDSNTAFRFRASIIN